MLDNFKKFIKAKNTKLPYDVKDIHRNMAYFKYGDMFSNSPDPKTRTLPLTSPSASDRDLD